MAKELKMSTVFKKIVFITVMILTVTVAFAACVSQPTEKYTVTYNASEGGYIQGEATQEVEKGSDASAVTAVANSGYKFKKWSDGKEEAERHDTNITEDKEVTAEFEFCFESGKGTTEDPYVISEYKHLIDMRLYPTASYKLKNDLDLSREKHEPIFDNDKKFTGKFDGDGKSIKNLTINSDSEYPSLFGYIGEGAEVGNFKLEKVNIIVNGQGAEYEVFALGALAGINSGFIHDMKVEVDITIGEFQRRNTSIGGLVGCSEFGKIDNCETDINVNIGEKEKKVGQNFILGGLIGESNSLSITNCVANGTIKSHSSEENADMIIGGLIGSCDVTISSQKICSCSTDVEITAFSNVSCGGFIGRIYDHAEKENVSILISECTAQGNIVSNKGGAGGFIYELNMFKNSPVNIEKCYAKNDVTASGSVGGFISKFYNTNAADKISEITDCHAYGNVVGHNAAGFCAEVYAYKNETKSNILISGCSANGSVAGTGDGEAAGFIYQSYRLDLEKCCSTGQVTALLHGGGFAFLFAYGTLNNCYSVSNVELTNTDPQNGRTLVGGFIFGLIRSSQINNCYYAGDVKGIVRSHNAQTDEPIVGAFIGYIEADATVVNSHCLHREKTFATDVIEGDHSIGELGLTVYDSIEEMYYLADTLNGDSGDIWVNVPDSTPKFK